MAVSADWQWFRRGLWLWSWLSVPSTRITILSFLPDYLHRRERARLSPTSLAKRKALALFMRLHKHMAPAKHQAAFGYVG